MKKKISFVLVIILLLINFQGAAFAKEYDNFNVEELSVNAKGAVIMEINSSRVLYAKNATQKLPMASTTKIMTAILAIEKATKENSFKTIIEIPKEAAGVEGSSIYLSAGEKISVEDLLYALMLKSGNDAAVALAIYVGGSVENFCALMNEKAKQIGAFKTNFVNPHGLPNENHYTTAYDFGLIACYAMKNETFAQIVSTKTKTLDWQGHEGKRTLRNGNRLLFEYDGAIGVKTGFTKVAGRCLVGAAKNPKEENFSVVTVVLNAPDMFETTKSMFDYAFENYKNFVAIKANALLGEIPVVSGERKTLELVAKDDIVIPVRNSEMAKVQTQIVPMRSLVAPVAAFQKIADVNIFIGDQIVYKTELFATQSVDKITFGYYFNKTIENLFKREKN